MNDNLTSIESKPIPLRSYALGVAVLWTLLILISLFWNVTVKINGTFDVARIEAVTAFEKDAVYRRWNADHSGVYVPVTKETQPNPYLVIPERDITTPSGKKLTKINPAYMTRQVHEIAMETYGVKGHITSLNPIRPANAPDSWESLALQAFQEGAKEVSSVNKIEGKSYMRLMRPLYTTKSCLKCHAAQGYKVGDIRGGISVAVPMAPFTAIEDSHILALLLGHGLLWLAGLTGIGLGTHRLNRQITERKKAEEALKKSKERLEAILHSMPIGIVIIDQETHKIVDVNPKARRIIGAPLEQIVGSQCHDFICPAENGKCPITDFGQRIDNSERVLINARREGVPILKTVIPAELDDRKLLIECFVDISEYKRAEQERIEKEKLRGVIEMAGAVCHELNQPMQVISGYSELFLMEISENNAMFNAIGKVKDQIERMAEITRKLTTITRYETKDYLKGKIIDIDKAAR